MRTPLIRITVAFIIGILLGWSFLYFPVSICILAVSALMTAVILAAARRTAPRQTIPVVLMCLAGSIAFLHSAAFVPARDYRRTPRFLDGKHVVTGRIVSALDRDPGRTAFILGLATADGRKTSGKVRVSVREDDVPAGFGDTVRIAGRVYEPRSFRNPGGFDYAEYLARQGIFASMSVRSIEDLEILQRSHHVFRTIQDWRERIRRHFLSQTDGPGSAVLQAMVLGEEGGLTDEIRDRFMAAGVTHILSISGSHLGLVAFVCYWVIRRLIFLLPERFLLRLTLHADPGKLAASIALPPVVFYAFLAGGQVATLRSLVMILAALAAVLLDREKDIFHFLAAAALFILLAGPQALFDISFQLSFLSVLSIGYVVSIWSQVTVPAPNLLRRAAQNMFLLAIVACTASIATGPLVAYYFHQISLAGLLSNLIVVPAAGFVVVPLGLASGVISLFSGSLPLAELNQAAATLFYGIVTFFSRFPLSEIHPPAPDLAGLIAFGFFIMSIAALGRSRFLASSMPFEYSQRVSRPAVAVTAVSGAVLLLSLAFALVPKSTARITFLDVGQGDSALIELPSGRNVLIDGGGTGGNRFDMGRRVVAPYLWERNISRLDLVVLSHPHPDHMNGLFFVLEKFLVGEFWSSGKDRQLPGYGELRAVIAGRNIPEYEVAAPHSVAFGDDADIKVLHPRTFTRLPPGNRPYVSENNRSLVLLLTFFGRTSLFTGDISSEVVGQLFPPGSSLASDILKVPHHGSRFSGTGRLLSSIQPSIAIVSVGKSNPYRHPSKEVVDRCEQSSVRLFRTDRDGAVIVTAGQGSLSLIAWKDLLLERVSLEDPSRWGGMERDNWKRIMKRICERV